MRIGIITFHRAINYGAFLQCFSLKNYLQKCGHEVEVVDYWPKAHADTYKIITIKRISNLIMHPLSLCKYLLGCSFSFYRTHKRIQKYRSLLSKYFNLSKDVKYKTLSDAHDLSIDVAVYGSDQIWWKSTIRDYEGFDPFYWGNSIPKNIKRISYAASMGILNVNTEDKRFIIDHLKQFDYISVRENPLKELLSRLTKKTIHTVVDPVFLTSKEEWGKYIGNTPIIKGKYVLFYNLIRSDEANDFAANIARRHGLQLYEISGAVKPFDFRRHTLQTLDPLEFLNAINFADIVVTSSFHGTAFSLIFQKQFYSIGMGKRSGRVDSLLNMLGLSYRLVTDSFSFDKNEDIDYSVITPRISEYIKESKDFLYCSLKQ